MLFLALALGGFLEESPLFDAELLPSELAIVPKETKRERGECGWLPSGDSLLGGQVLLWATLRCNRYSTVPVQPVVISLLSC